MNAKEAREISQEVDSKEDPIDKFNALAKLGSRYWISTGYLLALKGEEFKALEAKLAKAREALDRIRTIDSPTFNGERITTLNPNSLSHWQIIAEEALEEIGDENS